MCSLQCMISDIASEVKIGTYDIMEAYNPVGVVILVAFLIVFILEKVAGFKNYDDAHFTEVMLIRDAEDEKRFKAIYGLNEIKKEY